MDKWYPASTTPGEQFEVIVFAPAENPPVFTAQIICGEWTRTSADIFAEKDNYCGDPKFTVKEWTYLPSPPTPDGRP